MMHSQNTSFVNASGGSKANLSSSFSKTGAFAANLNRQTILSMLGRPQSAISNTKIATPALGYKKE